MKNIKILFTFILLFIFSASIYGCFNDDANYANAYITIDINPSIEIITNDEGLVEQVNPLNYDAEILLLEIDFSGKTVDEVIDTIMNLALEAGYLVEEEENAIIITTVTDNEKNKDRLENKVNETISKFKERHKLRMKLYNENQRATLELEELAEELNISIGKLKMINKAMEIDPELTLEIAKDMSVKDLNKIITENRKELKELSFNYKHLYLYSKTKTHQEIKFKKIELIYQLIMDKDEAFFEPILDNNTVNIDDIKNLYKAYYEELKTLIDKYDEEALINEIKEDKELINLLENKLSLLEEKANLVNQFKNNKEQVREQLTNILKQIVDINEQINTLIKEKIETKLDNNISFRFYIDDDNTIQIAFNYNKLFNQVKEKYETLFSELNIELEALEELFSDEINENLQQFRQECKDKLNEIKNRAKEKKMNIRND